MFKYKCKSFFKIFNRYQFKNKVEFSFKLPSLENENVY